MRHARPYIEEIIDKEAATDYGLNHIMDLYSDVVYYMSKAVDNYKNVDANLHIDCHLADKIDAEGWTNILSEVGRQRMLGQKVMSQFLLAARGVTVEKSRTEADTTLAAGSASMQTCIEGSYWLKIPSPPSQRILNALLDAQKSWKKFEHAVEKGLRLADLADADLSWLAYHGEASKHQMDHVAELYVNSTLASMPTLAIVLVEISWRQLILLQEMMKQSLLVSLGQSPEASALALARSVSTFEASHVELLVGRVVQMEPQMELQGANSTNHVEILFPDRNLPRTSNACALAQMMTVVEHFDVLKVQLQQVVSGGFEELAEELSLVAQAWSHSQLSYMHIWRRLIYGGCQE